MFAPRWILLACGIAALSFRNADRPNRSGRGPALRPRAASQDTPNPTAPSSGRTGSGTSPTPCAARSGMPPVRRLSATTDAVGKMLGFVPGGSRTYNFDQAHAAGSIDSYIFADFQANGITPAPKTTDWEFVRRITLDLTGRIPTPDRVLSLRRRYGSRQARQADRGTAGQAGMGRQVDDVFRRPVPEHGPQAEHRPAPLPDGAQRVLRVDQGLAQPTASRTTRWPRN